MYSLKTFVSADFLELGKEPKNSQFKNSNEDYQVPKQSETSSYATFQDILGHGRIPGNGKYSQYSSNKTRNEITDTIYNNSKIEPRVNNNEQISEPSDVNRSYFKTTSNREGVMLEPILQEISQKREFKSELENRCSFDYSRLYKEDLSISDSLLLKIFSKRNRDAKSKAMQHNKNDDVSQFSLSSKSLYLDNYQLSIINNLQSFKNLEALYLRNNRIRKIENISHLVNLKKLDLSFNEIERIEDLNNLRLLENLSLYSNKIKELKGIYANSKLEFLSLGNNLISELEQLTILKNFPHLVYLSLEGNPISLSVDNEVLLSEFLPKSLIFMGKFRVKRTWTSKIKRNKFNFENMKNETDADEYLNGMIELLFSNICQKVTEGDVQFAETIQIVIESLTTALISEYQSQTKGIQNSKQKELEYSNNLLSIADSIRAAALTFQSLVMPRLGRFQTQVYNLEADCKTSMKQKINEFLIDHKEKNLVDIKQNISRLEIDLVRVVNDSKERINKLVDKFESDYEQFPKRLSEQVSEAFKLIEDLEETIMDDFNVISTDNDDGVSNLIEKKGESFFLQEPRSEETRFSKLELKETRAGLLHSREDILQGIIVNFSKKCFLSFRQSIHDNTLNTLSSCDNMVDYLYNQFKKQDTMKDMMQ